jgi:deoxyribodipyrimidine photo-lyase
MGSDTPVQVVWFKRDLRIRDHAPLTEAARAGPVLALYVYEPSLLTAEDMDGAHLRQVNAALRDLAEALEARGGRLVTRVGELPHVLEGIAQEVPIAALWSHEETTQRLADRRDRRVRRWVRARGIPWQERPQTGVVRRLASREGWAAAWEARMDAPPLPAPRAIVGVPLRSDGIRELEDMDMLQAGGLVDSHPAFRPVGERVARQTLWQFLTERGVDYRRAMSSPLTAPTACSRISEHLASGTLSIRQALHAVRARRAELREERWRPTFDARWLTALDSFEARLRWHCHFMQKLEDEPALEYRCACPPFEALRERGAFPDRLRAFRDAQTGVPFVDACLRALQSTGWLPFRMRAMLVSYAAWDLWLDWRDVGAWLARQFVDYEPGIHYNQLQMQSGTTGINTLRIYNPHAQGERFDPTGAFVRRWLPELHDLPAEWIHRPHEMPPLVQAMYGVRLDSDYPLPFVDHAGTVRWAKARVSEIRAEAGFRRAARAVYERHGSRAQSARARGLVP